MSKTKRVTTGHRSCSQHTSWHNMVNTCHRIVEQEHTKEGYSQFTSEDSLCLSQKNTYKTGHRRILTANCTEGNSKELSQINTVSRCHRNIQKENVKDKKISQSQNKDTASTYHKQIQSDQVLKEYSQLRYITL